MNAFPQSTYRLQFHAGFTFRDAVAIVPYLADLGVSHVYASSYLRARPGSTHGYDVIDHCRLNPELGRDEDFDAFLASLKQYGMSHILDIVPNHVGVATNDNAWWNDLLLNGQGSRYARYFDVAWESSPRPELKGKILLPVLGAPYGEVLAKEGLKLVREDEQLWVKYYDRRFPIVGTSLAETSDELDRLLQRQNYRLAWWRVAADEINYRRFFDINDLAALSMEREEVFRDTHSLILKLVRAGHVTGLRVDHPDGLHDPAQYLHRLQEAAGRHVYVVVEKILDPHESLPSDWDCDGTTGYDFLNQINGLFIDPAGEEPLTRIYQQLTGDTTLYADRVYANKRRMLNDAFSSELHMLTHRLDRIAQADRNARDFTFNTLRRALREVVACFPVYRSYIAGPEVSDADRAHIGRATDAAIARNSKPPPAVFQFIRNTLLNPTDAAHLGFAGRFQQLTAPVTAKGIEDTTFYQYHRLISLNEVGGDPSRFGVSPDDLHRYFASRAVDWPYALSGLSTHDTKRSEDVRARLNVLSEFPAEWDEAVTRWMSLADIPPDDAYLLFQTLVGAWLGRPDADFIARIQAYMTKAMREAKVRTTWTDPNTDHEQAVHAFIAKLLADESFVTDFSGFHGRIAKAGEVNSLAQTLLKLTAPGVPDTYQGMEMADFSLVDPDNRRPVNFQVRRSSLRDRADAKLRLHAEILPLRRLHPGLFTAGSYTPIRATGRHADRVFAFLRRDGDRQALTIVPRLTTTMTDWADTAVPVPSPMQNLFANKLVAAGSVRVADLLRPLHVALLIA